MKTTLLFALFLFIVIHANGQGICNDVLASAGNFETGASGSIAWTLGEVVSETVTSANNSVTQGFHQTLCCPVITTVETNDMGNLIVYPNPASQKITIDFGKARVGEYKIILTYLQGMILITDKFHQGREAATYSLDLTCYSAGIYLLNIQNTETGTNNVYRINKIN